MKRKIISIITLLMLIAQMILPGVVNATSDGKIETDKSAISTKNKVSTDNGNVEIGGNGSFGTLLADSINEQNSDENNNSQAGITNAQIESNIAKVTYFSSEKATIVVAIYNEEKNKIITTSKKDVDIAEEETEIEIEVDGEIPQYFVLKAFMIDKEKNPLCDAYENSTYTEEMQKLLAMTTNDFDADRVLNIDDKEETNFAIYKEETIIVNAKESGVTLKSADEENKIYVFENINNKIRNLKKDDILSYVIDEEQEIIVKVSKITISGNTATITGGNLELEEVFDYVKIETDMENSKVEVDEFGADGFTYNGMKSQNTSDTPLFGANDNLGGEFSEEFSFTFVDFPKLDKDKEEEAKDKKIKIGPIEVEGSGKITGEVTAKLSETFKFYQTTTDSYLEYNDNSAIEGNITATGKVSISTPLANGIDFKYPENNPKITIKYIPKFQIELSIKAAFSVSYESGQIIKVTGGTAERTSKPASINLGNHDGFDNAEAKVQIFIGVDWNPTFEIKLSKKLVLFKAAADFKIGALITLDFLIGNDTEDMMHECDVCFTGRIDFIVNISFEFEFFGKFKKSFSWGTLNKLKDFYISITHGEFGFGICPHKKFRTTIKVVDKDGKSVDDATIQIFNSSGSISDPHAVDSNGEIIEYLSSGKYYYICEYHGNSSLKNSFKVEGEPQIIIFNVDNIKDIYEDKCGDNANFKLYNDGLLEITGTGKLWDGVDENHPWGMEGKVLKVVVGEGITDLGNYQFANERNLNEVILPESLERIGNSSFEGCFGLGGIDIPDSVKEIGNYAFCYLTCLDISKLPSEIEEIGASAFSGTKITETIIPKSCKKIGSMAFRNCDYLKNISIACKEVGENAFENCINIQKLEINEGVEKIDSKAFYGCNINSINIANGLKYIGKECFGSCTFYGVNSIFTIPSSVETIDDFAFSVCSFYGFDKISIASKKIENSAFSGVGHIRLLEILGNVKTIGYRAFENCGIDEIHFEEGVKEICSNAFDNSLRVKRLVLPSSITYIGDEAFKDCEFEEIVFQGELLEISKSVLEYVENLKIVYYPSTWQKIPEGLKELENTITFIPYDTSISVSYNKVPNGVKLANSINNKEKLENTETVSKVSLKAKNNNYLSKYVGTSEKIENGNEKTSKFTGLVANENYILYVIKEENTDDMLSNSNILYIDQGKADENGNVSFTYIPKEETEKIVVLLYGKGNNEEPEEQTYLTGDVNGDGKVTLLDYGLVLAHVKRTKLLTGEQLQRADVNRDKKVSLLDYGLILAHVKKTKLLF